MTSTRSLHDEEIYLWCRLLGLQSEAIQGKPSINLDGTAVCVLSSRALKHSMGLSNSEDRRVFISFSSFGLLNNVLYVVILSAAIDLVGGKAPKSAVLLCDIIPSLLAKLLSPFFIQRVPYNVRLNAIVSISISGMLLISLSNTGAVTAKLCGICLASLSSGFGEISFLLLTHYYPEKTAIGGFSSGTGAAGIVGSFLFLLFTNILGFTTRSSLLIFAVLPLFFPFMYYFVLPSRKAGYTSLATELDELLDNTPPDEPLADGSPPISHHIWLTLKKIKPLVLPYMIPLSTVYVAEYVINQGVAPTLLFPLNTLPNWLFSNYRDIYVVYNFVYQLGVFISRSSVLFGIRVSKLGLLSMLQLVNLAICIYQSLNDRPFVSIWEVSLLVLYEGLLGGLLYVNTFMTVSESVAKEEREFAMGAVGISDSFGIMIAGCINTLLEGYLCQKQVARGRDWCRSQTRD